MAPAKKEKGKDVDVESKINEIIVDGPASSSQVKMEVDYSETTAEKVPKAKQMADEGRLEEALEMLLSLEKQTRTGCDMHSTAKILVAIVQMCHKAANWTLLNEHIIILSKRRAQLKAAVAKMVQECYTWVKEGKLPSKDVELKLIETLRTVTEGKIYVEVERARLTHRLARMMEEDGDVKGAAKTMQELQVETYGSMERREKVELILEQMRLCLATKDYIRTQIISKKINVRFFEASEQQDLKLKYYEYMIELDQNEGEHINICKHYRAVYDTPGIAEDKEKRLAAMRNVCLYVVLSPHDNEQSDLIHRVLKEGKVLEEIPLYKSLLEQFTNQELIDQARLSQLYEKELREGAPGSPPTGVFDSNTELGRKRWQDLKNRVVEHNIRIMAKYYTRVSLKRMSELLNLPENEVEDFLSTMVVKGAVEAKTDRLEGVVNFRKSQNPNDLLNEWSYNISELMSLVQKTTHLINKEEMVHKHMMAGGGGGSGAATTA